MSWTEEQLQAAIDGRITISRNGHEVPMGLNQCERIAMVKIQERGFLVTSGSRVQLLNAWRAVCELRRIPLITLRYGSRFAEIDVDMIFAEPLAPEAASRLFAAIRGDTALIKDADNTGICYSLGNRGAHSSRVILDRAEALAARCVEICRQDAGAMLFAGIGGQP